MIAARFLHRNICFIYQRNRNLKRDRTATGTDRTGTKTESVKNKTLYPAEQKPPLKRKAPNRQMAVKAPFIPAEHETISPPD